VRTYLVVLFLSLALIGCGQSSSTAETECRRRVPDTSACTAENSFEVLLAHLSQIALDAIDSSPEVRLSKKKIEALPNYENRLNIADFRDPSFIMSSGRTSLLDQKVVVDNIFFGFSFLSEEIRFRHFQHDWVVRVASPSYEKLLAVKKLCQQSLLPCRLRAIGILDLMEDAEGRTTGALRVIDFSVSLVEKDSVARGLAKEYLSLELRTGYEGTSKSRTDAEAYFNKTVANFPRKR
jgi:hypothetical protein